MKGYLHDYVMFSVYVRADIPSLLGYVITPSLLLLLLLLCYCYHGSTPQSTLSEEYGDIFKMWWYVSPPPSHLHHNHNLHPHSARKTEYNMKNSSRIMDSLRFVQSTRMIIEFEVCASVSVRFCGIYDVQ